MYLCRLFLYENIPQLRYHNPNVKFSFEAHHDPDSMLHFTLGELWFCLTHQEFVRVSNSVETLHGLVQLLNPLCGAQY